MRLHVQTISSKAPFDGQNLPSEPFEPMKFRSQNRGPLVRSPAAQYGFGLGIGQEDLSSRRDLVGRIFLKAPVAEKANGDAVPGVAPALSFNSGKAISVRKR